MSAEKPKVKTETEYIYTNKFSQKEIRFTPKADEVVATFAPMPERDVAHDVMGATEAAVSQGVNVERGFAVFQVPPDADLETATRSLADQPQINNTIPVLILYNLLIAAAIVFKIVIIVAALISG